MADNQTSSTSSTAATSTTAASTTAATAADKTTTAAATTDTTKTAAATTAAASTTAASALTSTTDTAAAAPADWPADWREKLAGGDEKKLTALKRYASPQAYSDSGFQLRHMMDSKQLKAALPANATPEDVTRWRQENGIPEKSEGYLEKLDQGVITNDDDKALIKPFLEAMHGKNASPEVVNAALTAWNTVREQIQTEQKQNDTAMQAETEE